MGENNSHNSPEKNISEDNAAKALEERDKADGVVEEGITDGGTTSTGNEIKTGEDGKIESLGKVKTPEVEQAELKEHDRAVGLEIGHKNMPMESLPSKGEYYPRDFKLTFRAATLDEVKHYSSMNESDIMDVADKINGVLNSCIRVTFDGHQGSYEDLKEFDKIYMLFAIRDLSMLKHHRENKIFQEIKCSDCGMDVKKEITNDVFGYFDIDPSIRKYYDEQERGFVFNDETLGGRLVIYIPSIGTMKYITDYMKNKEIEKRQNKGGFYDKQFLTFLQFLVKDWRDLNENYVKQMYKDYKENWGYDKHDFMLEISEKISVTIKPTIEMKCERGHVSNPLVFFRRGYRSILGLSSTASRLLG